ncbi:MAG: RNA polymerase sigma factor [Pseudohongiellaceae bacterium]
MPHSADRALAKALASGDEREFDRFFTEYFDRLFRFAITRLEGNEQTTQDIVQNTLIGAMRGIDGYRGDASMFTWLCQICKNEINAHFRKLSRSVPVVPEDDEAIQTILSTLQSDVTSDPDIQFQGLQLARLIQEALDHLPSSYGNALEWKYIEGFSVAEIAQKLEITELAAQSTLSRAREAFRNLLVKLSPQIAGLST